jgi:L-Ala-D/L-Glu epimerase
MKVFYRVINTPFQYPFTISGGRTKTHQRALLIALQIGNYIGYGEAPEIAYYNITVEQMIADLEAKKSLVEKFAFTGEPERFWHYCHHLFPKNSFLVCALDMACWDMHGHMKKQLLHQLWNSQFANHIVTDYTIGIDSIDIMLNKVKAHPWPIYKVKLGTAADVAIIRAIREVTNSVIRVDANAGWTLQEAIELIPQLKELGVELVEQPLAKDAWMEMKELYSVSSLPLIADESCVKEEDVSKCVGHFHGINIKLTKCSGITPARRMITEARKLELQVMMGSMNENVIGSAAIAHFIPQLDFVDLDGPLLQLPEHANAVGLVITDTGIVFQGQSGLGVNI